MAAMSTIWWSCWRRVSARAGDWLEAVKPARAEVLVVIVWVMEDTEESRSAR